jgi:hypothetical protein
MEDDIINWLSDWYRNNCNGDWEHSYGIKIETLDNPGWSIRIDVKDTFLEKKKFISELIEKDENDWYDYKLENAQFIANGDPTKLSFLLKLFKKYVEEET